MAKTLENIRDMVRSFLDEPIAADWTDTELNNLINVRYHQLYTAVVDVFEEYAQLKVATTDIVADQQEYETQTDFLKMRRVEIKYDADETNYSRAMPISLDQVRRDLGNTSESVTVVRRPNYYMRGNIIGFIPIPSEAVTDGIKSWYYAMADDLTADSDAIVIPYPDRDYMLIAYGATADALNFGQQEPVVAEQMEKKWSRGVEMMQQSLEDRVSDEYKGVVDVTGDGLNFSEWNY